jgi:predicted RNase H-like nuclease (RuvC/YqgF family)
MVKSSGHTDKYLEYTSKIESLDEEITMLENEINILKNYIKKMEYKLRNMKGTLEKVFVNKYIDNISVNEIANKLHYSPVQIYRFLKKINRIIKDDKK